MAEDISRLPALLREAARTIPTEVDRIMRDAAEAQLPAVRAETPARTGQLRQATRVQQLAAGKVRFTNPEPYANTIHWGRRTLRGSVSVVAPSYFVYGVLADHQEQINTRLEREITAALARRLS